MRANKSAIALLGAIVLIALVAPVGAQAAFGIKTLSVESVEQGGGVDLRAGSHPFGFKVHIEMNKNSQGRPEGTLRQLVVNLPPGMIGNPQAVPRCPMVEFAGQAAHCPGPTQIGVVHLDLSFGGTRVEVHSPVFNLVPPLGVAASIGFSAAEYNSFQEGSVRTGSDYGVSVSDVTVPTKLEILSITETIWGVPAESAHDEERTCFISESGAKEEGCRNDLEPVPFFTLPTSCTGPLKTTATVSSVEEPLASESRSAELLNEAGEPQGLHACDRPPFVPTIEARPEAAAAESPTGLQVHLHVPQSQDPAGIATANLKEAKVTLPAGLVVNPSAAAGLGACTTTQVDLHGSGPASCPANSQLGTVQIKTPLLDHPLPGGVYLARQGENPFGSLIALYIAAYDPISGVVVKIAGKVEPNPINGQLTATFAENPQLPFEDLEIDFFGGPRASLTTPATCGTFTTTTDLTPWTTPEGTDAFPSDSFQINTGANGGGCISGEAQEPNNPGFEAGTTTPLAGSYSPFVLKLTRENGSQRFGALNVTLPPGLTGKLAGVARCSDAQLAAAAARTKLGDGAVEQASPSCPAASEVGTVTVGAGSGSPFYAGGHAYLAGPYKGAPFSLAIITPAVAGPFDLGVVVVRSGLYINPETAQVTVKSDPIPSILQGIPLDVRSIDVSMTRPEFTLNPTNCEATAVNGQAISTLNQVASLSKRFQVGGCQGLSFKPSFSATTQGKTSKANGASLVVKVAQKAGESNIRKVNLQLPIALPSRLTTLQKACTEAQFNANPAGCPEGSFIGTATAKTPILSTPLTGPAILVSHGGAAFPDVEFLLQGEGVHITLDGRTDIKKGITFSRFETVPDDPISSFETSLPEGPHSVLTANGDLCALTKTVTTSKKVTRRIHGHTKRVTVKVKKTVAQPLQMPTTITGQNGAQVTQTTKIAVTGCPKAKATKKPKAKKHQDKKRVRR